MEFKIKNIRRKRPLFRKIENKIHINMKMKLTALKRS